MGELTEPQAYKPNRKVKLNIKELLSSAKLNQTLQNLASITQIIAIVVAGSWAYERWVSDVSPSLKPALKMTSSIIENEWNSQLNACVLEYTSIAENVSVRSINISAVQYYFGHVEIQPLQNNEDYRFIQPSVSGLDPVRLVSSSDHRNELYPGEVTSDSLEVMYRPVKGSVPVIWVDLYGPNYEENRSEPLSYEWDYIQPCTK